MKKMFLLSALAMLAIAPLGNAADQTSDNQAKEKTTAKEVRKEIGDAAEAIKNYSIDKRDEAAKKAKESLDDLDSRISALELKIDKDWDKMGKAAREQARKSMKQLHEQRIKVAEWYGGLQMSTANAWEHTKKGFSEAYEDLKNAWEKAEREYQKDENNKKKN